MENRVTARDAQTAVLRLTALKYFPGEPHARAEIAFMLEEMVSTVQQLDWLVRATLNGTSDWKGIAQLRALLCVRFKPHDGIEAAEYCQISGFTPADCERDHQKLFPPSPKRHLLGPAKVESAKQERADLALEDSIKDLAEEVRLKAKRENLGPSNKIEEYKEPEWLKDLGV